MSMSLFEMLELGFLFCGGWKLCELAVTAAHAGLSHLKKPSP